MVHTGVRSHFVRRIAQKQYYQETQKHTNNVKKIAVSTPQPLPGSNTQRRENNILCKSCPALTYSILDLSVDPVL